MADTAPLPTISDHDRLGMTMVLAIVFHGIVILGITFTAYLSEESNTNTLDIILVQTHNPSENEDAEFLAQVTQQGGGESETIARQQDIFSAPTLADDPGTALQTSRQQNISQKNSKQIALLNQDNSDQTIFTSQESREDINSNENNKVITSDSKSARLAHELNMVMQNQSSNSRAKYLNSSTKEFIPAQYMRQWIDRVERIGNLNYPDKARREELSGTLILNVVINSDGRLLRTELRRSSGHKLLDDSAIRIVKLAAPFAPFPKKLKEETDIIHITRSWEFLNNNELKSR